jgi:Bcr/CflA subfamily drug resistance transporter
MNTRRHTVFFTVILSVCVLVPLANDLFISGMPEMRNFFMGDNISLVFSISLLGLAVAQPFYGPLSDRFGRKPVLLAGLLIYTLASAQVMFANTFVPLLIGRFFQAIGVCSAIASALPIARDTCEQDELVKASSLIMAIMGAGPALSPLFGSFLNNQWGWRASFVFLFVLGCFYLLWISIFLKETHINKNMEALAFGQIWRNYANLAKQPNFLKYCFASGFSYGVLFSYINLSPFFIIEKMHFNLINFGIIVAINALAIITMAIFTPKIAKKLTLPFTMQLGLGIIFGSGLLMWLLNILFTENIYVFMIPIFLTTVGIGMIRTTASAGAMQLVQSQIAGSAAAFFNLFSFISGFLAINITTKLIHTVAGFGLFITVMGAAALFATQLFLTISK